MRNKKKLCAGILMLLLLTGCSSQEVLQEVPQTIVLPESQIDTMPVQETAAAENDNTESFSLLEAGCAGTDLVSGDRAGDWVYG